MTGSIRRKILLTNAAVLILMIGASHLATYLHWRRQLLLLVQGQGQAMAAISAQRIHAEFMQGDIDGIRNLLRTLAQHDAVLHARITDGKGNVLLSSDPTEEHKTAIHLPASARRGEGTMSSPDRLTGSTEGLDFYVPIPRGPECRGCHYPNAPDMGVLQLNIAASELTRILRLSSIQLVVVTVLTWGFLFVALLLLFRREVDRPLSEILSTMRQAREGNLGIRAPIQGSDEMGVIASELNRMLEQLSTAREEVTSLHQQQLDRQERLATIGNLASAVAHEIKNPLAGIRGGIEVLEQGLPADDPHRELTREIVLEVDRINRLVRDLLYYSRRPVPETLPTRLDRFVDEVLAQARQLPEGAHIQISHVAEGPSPTTELDYQLVKQALLNVIQNAFDAMPHGGELKVRSWAADAHGYVSLSDNGPGMDPNVARKILQPFFTTRHRGTGLGLPIAQTILQAHGGEIRFRTEPGRGTEFTISLPAVAPEEDLDS